MSTTDTVTQEWMEAVRQLEKDEHGMYIHAANYEQMRLPKPTGHIHPSSTQDGGPNGLLVGIALAVVMAILITYTITIL